MTKADTPCKDCLDAHWYSAEPKESELFNLHCKIMGRLVSKKVTHCSRPRYS